MGLPTLSCVCLSRRRIWGFSAVPGNRVMPLVHEKRAYAPEAQDGLKIAVPHGCRRTDVDGPG